MYPLLLAIDVELVVPYWQFIYSSIMLASVCLTTKAQESGQRENGDLIRRAKASRGGTYFVPSSLRLQEVLPEEAVLSASPDALRAAR